MVEQVYIIERNLPVIKVVGRGRPRGSGSNLRTLAKMGKGDSLWDVPKKKMDSFRTSAFRNNIRLKIRRITLADGSLTNNYAIWIA
jgi:hypothetical protein